MTTNGTIALNVVRVRSNIEAADGNKEIVGGWIVDNGRNALINLDFDDFGVIAGHTGKITLTNTWRGADMLGEASFSVIKQDKDSGEPIEGVKFSLTQDGKVVDVQTTNAEGKAFFNDLPEGVYILTEIEVPAAYDFEGNLNRSWTVEFNRNNGGNTELKKVEEVIKGSSLGENTWNWQPIISSDKVTYKDAEITITNELIKGKVSVTKALLVDAETNPDAYAEQEFVFNIYAGENPAEDVEPVATLTVKPGQTGTTADLPFGTYTIKEAAPAEIVGYDYKGVIFRHNVGTGLPQADYLTFKISENAKTYEIVATNNYTSFPAYAPQVSKAVAGANAPAATFSFNLEAAEGNNAAGYTMPDQLTTTVVGTGTASFGNILFKQAGVYNFTITEQNDGSTGFTYDEAVWTLTVNVAENEATGDLEISSHTYTKAGLEAPATEAAQFVNRYEEPQQPLTSVTVNKVWAGVPEGQALPANAQMQLMRNGEAYGPVVAVNAAGGWTHTWNDLPARDGETTYSYTVQEINVPAGYTSATVANGGTFTITNSYQQPATGSLTISKTLAGNAVTEEIRGREFTIQVLLFAADGQTPLAGQYPYTGAANGAVGQEGTIALRGGQSVTITGLPEGTVYRVLETEANGAVMSYTTYSDEGLLHVINENDADTVEVRNFFNNVTPNNPGGNEPGGGDEGGNTPELPNPNDSGSPDEVTIFDEGVPLTYLKVEDPNNEEEFVYLPEDEVPLAEMPVPKTGDNLILWLFAALASAICLLALKRKQD